MKQRLGNTHGAASESERPRVSCVIVFRNEQFHFLDNGVGTDDQSLMVAARARQDGCDAISDLFPEGAKAGIESDCNVHSDEGK